MPNVKIGNVRVQSDGTVVVFQPTGSDGSQIQFDREGVRELLSFLRGALEAGSDQRQVERILVSASSGLSIKVSHGGQSTAAQARNISLRGMLLEPLAGMAQPPSLGDTLRVVLLFESIECKLTAIIQRRAGTGYGLLFCHSDDTGSDEPPQVLRKIIETLRQRRMDRVRSLG